jgi:hypothetical protein
MDTSRLFSVIDVVDDDLATGTLQSQIQAIETAYQATLQSATETTTTALSAAVDVLESTVRGLASYKLAPSALRILERVGASTFVGEGLIVRVREILAPRSFTPAQAIVELQKLRTAMSEFQERARDIIVGFQAFGISKHVPDPTMCEVSISLPTNVFDGDMEGLESELKQFDHSLRTFSELTGETSTSPTIKSVSTGSIEVIVLFGPLSALALVKTLRGIVSLYNDILDIRLKRQELAKKNVPQDVLQPLLDYESKRILEKLEEIHSDVLASAKINDGARRNELSNQLSIAIRVIAGRIDDGVDVEVTAPPEPKETPDGKPEASGPGGRNVQAALRGVREDGAVLRQLPPVRDLLPSLPAPDRFTSEGRRKPRKSRNKGRAGKAPKSEEERSA